MAGWIFITTLVVIFIFLGVDVDKVFRRNNKEKSMSFNQWMIRFVEVLIQSGMPVPQAHRYWREFRQDARDYFEYGLTPEEAATAELMPF